MCGEKESPAGDGLRGATEEEQRVAEQISPSIDRRRSKLIVDYILWIYHHYCAMLMALISLTWEIRQQPDCAYKQISTSKAVYTHCIGQASIHRLNEWMSCGEKLLVLKVNSCCYALSFSFYR
ncbi:hypothetical protein GW17_00010307 [Ensete ventricosum]|nr:hypothetical protein GW17_00010307 [Ensete ventricosum]RZS05502.1 hypothetical protein BHM03_00036035 [Ensete ventricosum]